MLAMVAFDYTAYDVLKKMTREDYIVLDHAIPQLNLSKWSEEKTEAPSNYFSGNTLIDLTTDGPILAHYGLKFSISRFKGTYKSAVTDGSQTHTHIHVAIPAVGLLCMDEVMVLDDACTVNLNSHLTEGWRIVAVCPPDAQRRPDYIIGRSPDMREKYGEKR